MPMYGVTTYMEKRGILSERMPLVSHIFLIVVSVCFSMLYACSVDPEEENVKNAIIKHFEARNYKVVYIELDKLEQFPLGKREYMAPKKYTVQIPLIKLEASGHRTDKRQSLLIFKNASITIRSTEKYGVWMVENIEGIPLT